VACELSRYDIDIAALSETRLVEEWSLNEVGGGYTFFEVFFSPQHAVAETSGIPNRSRRTPDDAAHTSDQVLSWDNLAS